MSDTPRPVTFIPGENAPMSPHLSVWKFSWTMAASISHRITGVGNAIGMLLLTAWIASAAISAAAFDAVSGFLGSPFGLVLLFGFTLSLMFHFLNGVRYLLMDSGKIISKQAGNVSSALAYVGAVMLTAIVFFIGLSAGGIL